VVVADFRRLRQVLANLLGNAAKFTRDGCIVFAVEAQPAPAGQAWLRVTVQDDGIGIAADERARLLLPFTRGSNAHTHEGSGLGLSIVAQLLQLMGATLHIDAAPGGGSLFSFELRLAVAGEEAVEAGAELPAGTVDGGGRIVLVVDDQAQNRELLCDLLDGSGFVALAAADGHAGLRLLRERQAALVLTDQRMDGLDGWGLLAAVRRQWPGVPVVLCSAAPPHRPAGFDPALSFDACLLKPVVPNELLAQVDALAVAAIDGQEGEAPRRAQSTGTARHVVGESGRGNTER
jgi:two-component system, sensor histidine kinase LadS